MRFVGNPFRLSLRLGAGLRCILRGFSAAVASSGLRVTRNPLEDRIAVLHHPLSERSVPVNNQQPVDALIQQGVIVPCPGSVEVGTEVDPKRIAPGVTIHTGCKLLGARTAIGPGSVLGAEAPVTLEQCQLGRKVELKGGFFSGATFLDGSNMASGAHVRAGTLLEEEANAAHTVGLKQTLFLPFVTAGSLVNFCDALMAGGTSRKNHSEIGSSYIHFNYTPHQDKATPSLIGDVPRGVMLQQAPIFLGGQGGLVGPVRIAYGSVIPAGTICRQDILDEARIYVPPAANGTASSRAFRVGAYRAIQRIVVNNLIYIGNVQALKQWYRFVRKRLMTSDRFAEACYDGALVQLDCVIGERIKRLRELAEKMGHSIEYARNHGELSLPPALLRQQETLRDRWPELESHLSAEPASSIGARNRDAFLSVWERIDRSSSYLKAIGSLRPEASQSGTDWLQAVVDSVSVLWNHQ
jgi:bifunctional UDP-N-acetylglucosamine pyrophosphorylase / glucosamine-1-phosphate N-acetyltransferase